VITIQTIVHYSSLITKEFLIEKKKNMDFHKAIIFWKQLKILCNENSSEKFLIAIIQ